jgi:ribose 5-phosphate isomerase RpiB
VESEEENHTRHFVSGSLAALGVVGLGVGVGFTLAANKASSDVTKYSDMVGPESYTCEGIIGGDCGSLSKAAETRRKDTNVAKGSFVIGGTLLAAGVITYFVWPKSSKEVARIVPWVGKDVAGFSYGKEF